MRRWRSLHRVLFRQVVRRRVGLDSHSDRADLPVDFPGRRRDRVVLVVLLARAISSP
jgi:hypothetical protein